MITPSSIYINGKRAKILHEKELNNVIPPNIFHFSYKTGGFLTQKQSPIATDGLWKVCLYDGLMRTLG